MTEIKSIVTYGLNLSAQQKAQNISQHEQDIKRVSKELGVQVATNTLKEVVPMQNDLSLNESHADKMFKELLRDEFSKKVAEQNDFGISQKIENTLNKTN